MREDEKKELGKLVAEPDELEKQMGIWSDGFKKRILAEREHLELLSMTQKHISRMKAIRNRIERLASNEKQNG